MQQSSLVEAVDGVATLIDDAATTTGGFGRSMTRAQLAVTEGSQAAGGLAAIFERLSLATEVMVFGVRPLEPLAEPFGSSVGEFRRLSDSLGRTGDSLADNARDVTQVAGDLRRIHEQLQATSTRVQAFQSSRVVEQSLTGLDLGMQMLLGVVFFEATLSGLTGIALFVVVGLPQVRPIRLRPDASEPNDP